MTDHLANRQTVGLDGDHSELNAKLEALARHFDLDWLMAHGANPLQRLWMSRGRDSHQ
jgi:Arc/MetJ family transcription regulator